MRGLGFLGLEDKEDTRHYTCSGRNCSLSRHWNGTWMHNTQLSELGWSNIGEDRGRTCQCNGVSFRQNTTCNLKTSRALPVEGCMKEGLWREIVIVPYTQNLAWELRFNSRSRAEVQFYSSQREVCQEHEVIVYVARSKEQAQKSSVHPVVIVRRLGGKFVTQTPTSPGLKNASQPGRKKVLVFFFNRFQSCQLPQFFSVPAGWLLGSNWI